MRYDVITNICELLKMHHELPKKTYEHLQTTTKTIRNNTKSQDFLRSVHNSGMWSGPHTLPAQSPYYIDLSDCDSTDLELLQLQCDIEVEVAELDLTLCLALLYHSKKKKR